MAKGKPQNKNQVFSQPKAPVVNKTPLTFVEGMTVADIAKETRRQVSEIIKSLMMLGIMATQNERIDKDTAELLCSDLKIEFKVDESKDMTNFDKLEIIDDPSTLKPRPPVVTIMGHVDHGKTTLLDTIRSTRVAQGEAGGITQAVGAYQVVRNGHKITFIDTPGHAAFTEMRSRGAMLTDIVVIVVAADDGVMPQTKEAIDHAKAAKCPIIVAINKIDRPNANPDRAIQELAELGLMPEDWGGDTPFVRVSALKGTNIDQLLDTIELVAEVEEYKANPDREGIGYVVEAKLDKSKGPTATVLVKAGTLRVGDILVCGDTWGKVRVMTNELSKQLKEATPSDAVVITGLVDVPQAGDKFMVFTDEKEARQTSDIRKERTKNIVQSSKAKTIDELFIDAGDGSKEINVVLKADTSGSVEAVKGSLEKISVEGIKLNVIRESVGGVTETDCLLALASNAIILGFNVVALSNVKDFAKQKGIEIRTYNIIYKLLEEMEAMMKGMLAPVYEEVSCGEAEVKETYKVSKLGTIAGCMVTNGFVRRTSHVSVTRDGSIIYEGKLASLKRFKDDAKEVKAGFDCGIMIEGFNDIKVGDVFVFSITEEVKDEK